ncbi:hypothetical protein [Xanthomarina gelatinilytica]|uniref:hypothetical protein n=1 Tax=Xanthomarina gelatinilytica TaxID=1137281 RepID=UPI003AA85BA8
MLKSLTKIKEQTGTKGSNTQNRLVHSSAYGFYIDTDVATYMENANGSYHSYTFPVIRDNPTVALENILFSLQADGTYKVSLVSYNLTENEKEALLNGQFVDLTNKIFKENINGEDLSNVVFNKEIQTTFTTSNICACEPNHPAGIDPNTNAPCSCFAILITITGTNEGIEDEGEEDIHNNNDIQEEENNSGGGVSNSPNNSNNDATSPTIFISYEEQIINCLGTYILNGNSSIQTWLSNANQRDKKALATYLGKGDNCSNPATLDFVVEAIEAILDGGEVDFEENIIYDNSLNEFPCHKITIQEATGSCSLLTQLVLDAFEANDYVNLIFETSNTINSNANTSSNSVYNPTTNSCNITIKFRESYLEDATDLSIARTAIHESLHAILVYMYEDGLLESENGLPMEGFEDFVEAYANYMGGLPENIGVAHHELMTDFIEEMATSLSAYALENGYSNSFNFYKKLCWSGDLINTPTFQSLYPQYVVPSDEINNPTNINPDFLDIININAAEQDNTTYIYPHPNGTTYEHSPKGNPPNSDEPCN